MKLSLTWPRTDDTPPLPTFLKLIRQFGWTELRVTVDHRHAWESTYAWIMAMLDAGLRPWALLGCDRRHPDIDGISRFCERLEAQQIGFIEGINEGWIAPGNDYKIPPPTHAGIIKAMRRGAPSLKILLGAEHTKPVFSPLYRFPDERTGEAFRARLMRRTYGDEVINLLDPSHWDISTQHPYCNPGPLTLEKAKAEYQWYQAKARGKPVWYGEGPDWHESELDPQTVKQRVWDMLNILEQIGVPKWCGYAMIGDVASPPHWGYFNPDHTPTPKAFAVSDFAESRV